MSLYLDPKNDIPFKKIFVEHKELMISFLNSLLPLPSGCIIQDIEYQPVEQLPDIPILRDSFVDIKCRDNSNRHFIVEMQMYFSKIFLDRMLYNASKVYIRELEKGDDYDELRPVYGLAILNDVKDKNHTHYYHRYRMKEETHNEEVIEGLDITLIELPLFKPTSHLEESQKELWILFLKEIGERTDAHSVPREIKENRYTKEALKLCEVWAYSAAERASYDNYWSAIKLRALELSAEKAIARREGLAEGRAEGMLAGVAQGKAEGKAEGLAEGKAEGLAEGEKIGEENAIKKLIDRLKSQGKTKEEISGFLGIPIEDI